MTALPAVQPEQRLVGLPPVADACTRVLILGSFPGAASLAAQQYYGHPRNHFWPIMAHVLGSVPEPGATYAHRCQWLLDHGVGLWDVYASCQRQGSLDADIRQATVNDFSALLAMCPRLTLVGHNGGESHRHACHTLALGVTVVRLPSTSPANASWSLERKKAAWEAALVPVLKPEQV